MHLQLCVVAILLLSAQVGAQGPGNPPRPPGAFPAGGGGPGGGAPTVQYLPQGIVAVGANPAGGSGGSPGAASPAANTSPSLAAQPSPSPAPASPASPSPSPPANQGQQGAPVQAPPVPQVSPAANPTPTPPAQFPQQTRGPAARPTPKPAAVAGTPQAQPVPAQNASPASAPATAPAADTALPPAAVQVQVQDVRNTVVDARLRLLGPRVWPFDARAQDALVTALASVMTAVPRSAISVVSVAQDPSQAGRRLQQATPATDAHVSAKAGDAATANTARSQLQEAASNGKLADALRQNSVEIDSVSLLSADLAAPDAAGSSSGPNIGVIVGGIAGAVCGIAIIIVAVLLFMRLKRRHKNAVPKAAVQPEPEFKAKPFYEAYSKGPEPDMTDIEADAVLDSTRAKPQPVEHALARSARGSGALVAAHSRNNSNVSERVQTTIDSLQSHMDELKQMAPALPEADEVEPHAPLHLTPSESMHPLGRIAAANSQLSAFTSSLDSASARPTVAKRRKLAAPGATGSKVMQLNGVMQYLTENSRFAGVLDMFDVDEVALGNGVHNPACIVTERGAYSLATYMSRMERNPSASRQKSTLTQLLDCVAYLHGRSMVHRDVQPSNLVWSDGVSRWRLTGCESWARKGSDAPLSYSLRYAAPEAILQVVMADCMGVAMRLRMAEAAKAARPAADAAQAAGARGDAEAASVAEGPTHHVVQAATDMWAVGACAWELLTGRPLFGDNFSDEDVVMALLGVKPLPFEADPSLWVLFHDPQMKNPVFPTIVFGERVSHLQFLRLPRARDRVNAADGAGPWATVGVLVEKSKPRSSAKGSMYSLWKLSDLDGTMVTMFLFGDSHQEHFRESEGSLVAIMNAVAESDGKGLTLKVNEASSILKLATSADFAFCGSRKKDGSKCRNPVNISKCRFCDYHVQSESRRVNNSRGVLQDSSHAARLNTQAEQAAQRQKKPNFAPYVPKQMTDDELAVQTVSYSSQGARQITALRKAAAQENSCQSSAAQRPSNALQTGAEHASILTGRRDQEGTRELPCYTGARQAPPRVRQQLQAIMTLPRTAGVDPARPPRAPLPPQQTPLAARPAATAPIRPRPAAPGSSAQPGTSARPAGDARGAFAMRTIPGSGSGTAAVAGRPALQHGLGRSAGGAAQAKRAEAGFVMLEEAEIEWDAADVAALKRHSRPGSSVRHVDRSSGPEDDNEEGGNSSHVRLSGVRCPEPASFAAGSSRGPSVAACRQGAGSHPADTAAERARQEAMRKAVALVKTCGMFLPVHCALFALHGGIEAAREAAKRDQQATAVKQGDRQPADASGTVPQQSAPSAGPTAAPTSSGTGPGAKPAGRPSTNFYGAPAAASTAHRGGAAAAVTQPKAAAARSGTRTSLEVKLGLRPKSSVKAPGSSAARAKPLVVHPGTSAFAAAFGSIVTEEDMQNVGTRYKETVDDEEAEKLDKLLGSMQKKDELQQRGEAITQLSVTAWHCTTCDIITERRKPKCQDHAGKRVDATKRWWTCSGCNNRFTTVGVKYPKKRCPNPRCTAPNSEFKKSSMGRAAKTLAGAEAPVAAREHFLPRGKEHGFAVNS
ncbi:hypothetical protein COCSUDRAFT_46891 [Coccomyxa subellipsoidea C-169]|uniref:Protein MCM10 homolog n=1 Tax=Coccomyxa subellipsoidea (strain C-169) TaxID=574566 RepID=I0Z1X7_COCSC|nr:hypothetical protein COCSUDRAFT_46891 [Coccomyxa subellipsoidea C-169]EIE24646.1 hypothetical protein COCSUDRAFT_46891 [Coccomyxa subellipsoidea C-169]|eukprot:XP_005649190.1 hypothetical protein COCSUDRAFT_46891 [Coccomyxa subellipsoidea C-169]